TVEATPVPDVEIDLPAGLQVVGKITPPDGWKAAQTGQTLHFRGGPFRPLTCPSFTITAQAAQKGCFLVPYVLRDANGNVVARAGAPTSGQQSIAPVVYAGVKPPSVSSGGGPSVVVIGGIALIGVALLLAGGRAFQSWRLARAEERAEELDD